MQRYQILSQNEIEQIHETSLRILEEVGVVFKAPQALEIFAKGGARVDGDRVYIPANIVEAMLKKVPSSFTVRGRNPGKNVIMNTERTNYAGPWGPAYILDAEKGRRMSTLDDYIALTKILQMMDNIDIMTHMPCEPNDIPVETRPLEMCYQTLKHSDKPLCGSSMGYEATKQTIKMASIVFGGIDAIKEKPAIFICLSALTPLSFDDKSSGSIIACAEHRQPLMVNSLCIAGATAPATVAGTVALQNAEVLSGIILAQMVNEGTPIIYGASASNAEMRTGSLVIGTPEDAVFSLVNGQLAKYYNLPCRNSGALSDSKCLDAQSAYETAITLAMGQMSGGNFILHGGGVLDSYNTLSFEKLMIDDEIIGMLRRIGRGADVNTDTLAYDVIKEVGPLGEFLTHEHTFAHFRKEFYQPVISDRSNATRWEETGSLTAEQRANARWKQLLDEYDATGPLLDKETDKALVALKNR